MKNLLTLILFVALICYQASCASDVQKKIYGLLRPYFNQKASIGIMANINVETGGKYDYTTKQVKGKGYGLFQFDFLKDYYFGWLVEQGLTDSAQNQIRFVFQTLNGSQKNIIGGANAKKIWNYLNDKTKTVAQLTQYFCLKYQKPGVPHLDRRKAIAAKLAQDKDLTS